MSRPEAIGPQRGDYVMAAIVNRDGEIEMQTAARRSALGPLAKIQRKYGNTIAHRALTDEEWATVLTSMRMNASGDHNAELGELSRKARESHPRQGR